MNFKLWREAIFGDRLRKCPQEEKGKNCVSPKGYRVCMIKGLNEEERASLADLMMEFQEDTEDFAEDLVSELALAAVKDESVDACIFVCCYHDKLWIERFPVREKAAGEAVWMTFMETIHKRFAENMSCYVRRFAYRSELMQRAGDGRNDFINLEMTWKEKS